MACHESARLARAFAEGDDASVSVALTWRLSIQSAAPVNSSSASRNSEASGACAERSSVVARSARWAISGIGIGVIGLAGPSEAPKPESNPLVAEGYPIYPRHRGP
jgi:hypothetical protein